ncbi:hypothetical protein KDX27_41660 [Burkholderia cenocepacia]|uniref:hypothetical protein n=1 Tax=Burkholderia cenocepacia TaxID=95486 RepID=UPI001B9880C1|nr:hypothetical protein [Burkholderia cenocepacia]MBR8029271.1 hypothetical protein [Burkholderia cenocepacia]MBR8174178.1 hypothetical protein [Burkholderia cenocepacia]
MTTKLTRVAGSEKSAHQQVHVGENAVGEIWREKVKVVVSKLTVPRVTAERWRWFAKQAGSTITLGRGTRAAMLLGPVFKTKDEAIAVLMGTTSRAGA